MIFWMGASYIEKLGWRWRDGRTIHCRNLPKRSIGKCAAYIHSDEMFFGKKFVMVSFPCDTKLPFICQMFLT